jgi:hypothetical protein
MKQQPSIQRTIADSLREHGRILKETYIYPVVGALAAVPAVFALAGAIYVGTNYPTGKPQLSPSTNPSAMVWSYPGKEYQARNFKDEKPFGSLDEVVLRTPDGRVVTLSPNDDGFEKQERVYKEKIVPMYE